MSKKNLDKLFQEKFEEFSDIPTENVWKAIEASLNKKKKSRKVIPIWWKLGGIAAVLAIGLFLVNPFETELESEPGVTNTDPVVEDPLQYQDPATQKGSKDDPAVADVDHDSNEAAIGAGIENNSLSSNEADDANNSENAVVSNSSETRDKQDPQAVETSAIAAATHKNESGNNTKNNGSKIPMIKESEATLAENIPDPAVTNAENTLGQNLSDNPVARSEVEVDEMENAVVAKDPQEAKQDAMEDKKKSIYDEIATQEEAAIAAQEPKESRWSAGPSIAPVYFNGLGEGSPVHSIFVPNAKSGDVNLSYGLAVSYEISKKLSIKTGVHKVDYGYNTNDVEFSASLEGFGDGQIDNIDYSLASRNIVVESKATRKAALAAEANLDVAAQDASLNGIMAQQLGYVEVPLELNYALLDRKLGVNLIGGFSSLFLIDNSVTLTSGELITEMGEANNVNDVNFSTNIGFGVNYKFTPKIQLNVEPVFKYQLNTFSETSGSFQPFTIGIYSGLNFKF